MNIIKQARGIVVFRSLRSVGHFFPKEQGSKHFVFYPCTCKSPRSDPLPNGLPETMHGITVNELVHTYFRELEALCAKHYPNWNEMSRPGQKR